MGHDALNFKYFFINFEKIVSLQKTDLHRRKNKYLFFDMPNIIIYYVAQVAFLWGQIKYCF